MNGWTAFGDGTSGGTRGSEEGIILRDEEHSLGARITLEQGGRWPYSITCGVYGWMVHTRFFATRDDADGECGRMKTGIEVILRMIPTEAEATPPTLAAVAGAIRDFVKYFD